LRLGLTCAAEIQLVSGSSPIPDSQITASSELDASLAPSYARLHNTVAHGAWCPSWADRDAPTLNMYIQVSTNGE